MTDSTDKPSPWLVLMWFAMVAWSYIQIARGSEELAWYTTGFLVGLGGLAYCLWRMP